MTAFDLGGPLPLGQTVVLQASAGTGKTHAVATLAARAIAEGVVSLDQLMVITFSSASTRELRSRVRQRLAQLAEALDRAADDVKPDDPAWRLIEPETPDDRVESLAQTLKIKEVERRALERRIEEQEEGVEED